MRNGTIEGEISASAAQVEKNRIVRSLWGVRCQAKDVTRAADFLIEDPDGNPLELFEPGQPKP